MSFKTKRTLLKNAFLNIPDFFYRLFSGQLYLPPYSLRHFVGGAEGFNKVGPWFLNDFKGLGVLNTRTRRILDIGCGSGRLAYSIAKDSDVRTRGIEYTGMDIDSACIEWCNRHIAPGNRNFKFFVADIFSSSYNPSGQFKDFEYRLPLEDKSCDLIILTSVFTHMLEAGVANYLNEIARLLTDEGTAYASFFVYKNQEEAMRGVERRAQKFPFFHGHYAFENSDFPENAVAYDEAFLFAQFEKAGLEQRLPSRYGIQDLFLLKRK